MKWVEWNTTQYDCCLHKLDYEGENSHGEKHQHTGVGSTFSNVAPFLSNTPFQQLHPTCQHLFSEFWKAVDDI